MFISAYRSKVTIDDQQEVAYVLSIGAKIDLGWPWRQRSRKHFLR